MSKLSALQGSRYRSQLKGKKTVGPLYSLIARQTKTEITLLTQLEQEVAAPSEEAAVVTEDDEAHPEPNNAQVHEDEEDDEDEYEDAKGADSDEESAEHAPESTESNEPQPQDDTDVTDMPQAEDTQEDNGNGAQLEFRVKGLQSNVTQATKYLNILASASANSERIVISSILKPKSKKPSNRPQGGGRGGRGGPRKRPEFVRATSA